MNSCLVCGQELKEIYKDYLEHNLAEYLIECPNKCYYEQFGYGSYEVGFLKSKKIFQWSYLTPHDEYAKIQIDIKQTAHKLKEL